MHIDFCFVDPEGRSLIAGWDPGPDPKLALMIGGRRVPVQDIDRFPRGDLDNRGNRGLMASFRLPDVSIPGGAPELAIIADGELRELPAERLTKDEDRLIACGVDELFAAYLRFIATGRYGPPGLEAVRVIAHRIEGRLRPLPAETPVMAASIDRLLVSPSGLGVIAGWCMTARAHPQALLALVSGERTLNPARILLDSIRREDLSGYRDRYAYMGTNGFCGAFRLPVGEDRDARMVLLSNVPGADFMFGRDAELVSDEEAAVALHEVRASLADLSQAQALTAAAASRRSGAPFEAPPAEAAGEPREVSVLLEVDVAPVELRDVLRLLHSALGGFTLHLVGRSGGELSRPIAAAVAEAAGEIRLGEPLTAKELLTHRFGRGWVIYGRASAFFQMPLPEMDGGKRVRVAYHDPVGLLPGRAEAPAWPDDLNPPFLLAGPAPLLAAGFRAVPPGFLTADGIMRAVLDLLDRHGLVVAERVGGPSWYPGTEMQSHPEYGIARALDVEMRGLLGQEARA